MLSRLPDPWLTPLCAPIGSFPCLFAFHRGAFSSPHDMVGISPPSDVSSCLMEPVGARRCMFARHCTPVATQHAGEPEEPHLSTHMCGQSDTCLTGETSISRFPARCSQTFLVWTHADQSFDLAHVAGSTSVYASRSMAVIYLCIALVFPPAGSQS